MADAPPAPAARTPEPPKKWRPGIGMPTALYLDEFGAMVSAAFDGETPYHVGSSLTGKSWRDVDVRLILADEDYERLGFGDPAHPHQNAKWVALVKAFAALAREMTGLPVDFQIQQRTRANATEDGPRSALGIHTYFRHHPPERKSP
jgi:hypothetical protein